MKFISSPLLLAAIALLSATGSIAQDEDVATTTAGAQPTHAPNSVGCTDGYCWAACQNYKEPTPDKDLSWEEGKNFCWLVRGESGTDIKKWDWAECEKPLDDCSLIQGGLWCDLTDKNSCSKH